MFNISFGEVCLIVTVGLIVIGPKRLPETARFLGHLVARVQRQAAGVKADIRREMDLEDLKSIHREYETAARNAEQSFNEQARKFHAAAENAVSPDKAVPAAKSETTSGATVAAGSNGNSAAKPEAAAETAPLPAKTAAETPPAAESSAESARQ